MVGAVRSGSVKPWLFQTFMWPWAAWDHSNPCRATNSPSALAASARAMVCRQARPSIPVQPGALNRSRKTDAQRLWSVRAATSSPAARIDAKASRGSPAPSDSRVWLWRSAWASHQPGNSRDARLVPQASGSSRRSDGGRMGRRYREPGD